MATVESVDVAIGETVEEGEILVRLAAEELQARVAQAEAALDQVRRNYEREKSLLEQDATTAETVRNLEDEVRLAEARLAEARTMLTYTEVPAPFDGTIIAKQVRRGDLATPGAPLLTIEGEGALRVHVQVPASLTLLEQGAPITVEASGIEIEGRLVEWSPAADPTSRTRLAKVQLPLEAPVRSGQYVRVQWPAEEVTALWAPASAISPVGQMDRVFVVEAGQAQLRFVEAGRTRDARVQILAGLEAGEPVVLDPAPELHDGQPVTVTE